ncbi:MAG TPA: hypothetical protein VG942_05105 [Hyphomonadaceae bacterium]|nr:hypothetical protein [Hyphomonadaceae bacterium]
MRILVAGVAVLALAGCVTRPSYSNLKPGDTEAQVLRTMNDCPAVVKNGRYEAFTYNNRMTHFFQWKAANYAFIFKDKTLVEFGEGTAGQKTIDGEPGLVLVPPKKPDAPAKQTASASCVSPPAEG